MNDIRARFEEIWPVPEGVYWSPAFGAYVCAHGSPVKLECMDLNQRLDTFTRCQETMVPVLGLVEEMVAELVQVAIWVEWRKDADRIAEICERAKQIMEQKK